MASWWECGKANETLDEWLELIKLRSLLTLKFHDFKTQRLNTHVIKLFFLFCCSSFGSWRKLFSAFLIQLTKTLIALVESMSFLRESPYYVPIVCLFSNRYSDLLQGVKEYAGTGNKRYLLSIFVAIQETHGEQTKPYLSVRFFNISEVSIFF